MRFSWFFGFSGVSVCTGAGAGATGVATTFSSASCSSSKRRASRSALRSANFSEAFAVYVQNPSRHLNAR